MKQFAAGTVAGLVTGAIMALTVWAFSFVPPSEGAA
jgi:hypothetical protein